MPKVTQKRNKHLELQLQSPVGAKSISFSWPLPASGRDDIVETIRWVIQDFPALKLALENNVLRDINVDSYPNMHGLCDRFNRTIRQLVALEEGTSLASSRMSPVASKGLLKHILKQVCNQAGVELSRQDQCEPDPAGFFDDMMFELVAMMLEHMRASPEDIFLDLGSRMGQVVLQVAGSINCKACYGIERAEMPSRYALAMDRNFRIWMQWYGKQFSNYQLIKGDFLLSEQREKMQSASIIYTNIAFDSTIDHQLKEMFTHLGNRTRIFSSRNFCSTNENVTERSHGDISAIMHVSEIQVSVSCIGRPMSFYLHEIDWSKLKHFKSPTPTKRAKLQKQPLAVEKLLSDYRTRFAQSVVFKEQVSKFRNREKQCDQDRKATETVVGNQIEVRKKHAAGLLKAGEVKVDVHPTTSKALPDKAKSSAGHQTDRQGQKGKRQGENSTPQQSEALHKKKREVERSSKARSAASAKR